MDSARLVRGNNTDGLIPHTAYTASTGGSSASTTLYALDSSGSAERALGGVPVLATKTLLGWRLVNAGAQVVNNLTLTYDGEEWRCGTPVNSSISVSYKVFNAGEGSLAVGDWVDAPSSLTFVPPVAGGAAAIDGNAAENRVAGLNAAFTGINLQVGQEIWFKWTFTKIGGGNILQGIDNVTVSAPLGTPPVIGEIPDVTVAASQTSVANSFTVNDTEDDASSTPLPTPTATSSKEAVVPSANVFFGGSGSNRTVYVVAGDTVGSADITVSVTDSDGNIGQQTFTVTVTPLNFPPVISTLPPTNTLVNVPVVVPFTVEDTETPASSLTVTASIADYSSALLENVALESDVSGTNWTATVTPVADADGVGIVTLSVSDPDDHTTAVSFAVMVLPAANVVFSEHFEYPLNTSIMTSSPGFWTRRNSSQQSINFRTSASDAQAWIRPKSSADDAAAPLAHGPYLPGSGAVLYVMLKAQWVDAGDTPVVGDSNGAFVLLAPSGAATADQLMQVATRIAGVPEGYFRLLVSNGESTYTEYSFTDLPLWTTYNIVVRHDVDTAKATLWIDGVSESSPSVSAIDAQAPALISHVCFRQEPNMGNIYVDDMKVIVVNKPRLTGITAPAEGNVEIHFAGGPGATDADFEVDRAGAMPGSFSGVSATFTSLENNEFKATVPGSGAQSYYRVKRKPISF